MDESLSDFQEKKTTYKEPKRKKPTKSNTIKKDKKLKGQKDIRTLVKSRKNELLTYTKDFDQACKNSGLDVDSEQLQIAIALSKSLHESQSQQDHSTASDDDKPLTAKERSRKIKLTLKEYGFKVPNAAVQNRKKRVNDRNSKLLNTSESVKRDIISSKYSEILEKNSALPKCGLVVCDHSDKEIYHKTTNIPYSKIRTIDKFYVTNLIEKATHKPSLLRDWSEIPGRPLSPVVQVNNFKFEEFLFSQQEFDCLLSYPLKEAQEIIRNISMKNCDTKDVNIDETLNMNLNLDIKINDTEICEIKKVNKCDVKHKCTLQAGRSQSPDLFDDDEYSTTVCAKDREQFSEIICTAESDKTFMDLTECVGNMNNIQKTIINHSPKLLAFCSSKISEDTVSIESESVDSINSFTETVSQNETFKMGSPSKTLFSGTVRDMNDIMEVTDCVISEYNHNDNNGNGIIAISKSTSLSESNSVQVKIVQTPHFPKLNPTNVNPEIIENIDFIQSTDSTKLIETNDLLTPEADNNEIEVPISMDLTQSTSSSEDFPVVKLCSNKEEFLDATIILYDNVEILKKNNCIMPNIDKSLENITLPNEIHVINKSQNNTSTNNYTCTVNEENYKMCSNSIFFEVNENIDLSTDNISKDKNDVSSMSINDESAIISDDNIDLTQSLESQSINEDKIDLTQSPQTSNITHSIESLGKQNNVSIDYDELYDNMPTVTSDIIHDQEGPINNNSIDSVIDLIDYDNDEQEKINKDKVINNIEDDQTLSQIHNFMEPPPSKDENCKINTIRSKNMNTLDYTNCSYLPSVEVKKLNKKNEIVNKTNHTELSPIQKSNVNDISFETPVNDQYIIKTHNVTPMLDYESMSTPVRNKELENYGIKPFKRKRAIQLLTYIYNETHPVIEDCTGDDIPSTSKKLKPDIQKRTEQIPDNQILSNYRDFKERDNDKENNLYMETKVNPDIKKIECCPDDWVFQTREKAKVHSCRVPLHITFYNYVSCRHLLRTTILRYEPVNIDIIHKDLIASGYRYNPKELLKFLDKKCITVKTTENNARNRKFNKS